MIKHLRLRMFCRIDGKLHRRQLVRRIPGQPDEYRWVPVERQPR